MPNTPSHLHHLCDCAMQLKELRTPFLFVTDATYVNEKTQDLLPFTLTLRPNPKELDRIIIHITVTLL